MEKGQDYIILLLPAGEPDEGKISIWYALEDEDVYKGFMEVTQDDDINEITFFMVPDIYQGHGYGAIMLEQFLDKYIPESDPDALLTAMFEYNGDYGKELASLFSDYGFEIGLMSYRECTLPFSTVYKRLHSKKASSYKGRMRNLAEAKLEVIDGINNLKDSYISERTIHESDSELSVAAISDDGKLEGLLLISSDIDRREVVVTDLYTADDESLLIRSFLAYAVDNAAGSDEIPDFISFVAVNEKLERVMQNRFCDRLRKIKHKLR